MLGLCDDHANWSPPEKSAVRGTRLGVRVGAVLRTAKPALHAKGVIRRAKRGTWQHQGEGGAWGGAGRCGEELGGVGAAGCVRHGF